MEKIFENTLVVKMLQCVVYDSMMKKVNEEKDYLNECSVDEFVKISELIRDDTEFNYKIIKDLIYNIIYRDDLKIVSNMLLCNLAYYLEKFDEIDYKHQEYMIQFLGKDYFTETKEYKGHFNKNLLKYIIELIKINTEKFYPKTKCNLFEILN